MQLSRRFLRLPIRLWNKANDRYLRIATASESGLNYWGPKVDGTLYHDNHGYAAPDYFYLRRTIRIIRPAARDIFYDVGCGKGRVLCVFARTGVQECVGVELLDRLAVEARRNAAALRKPKCPINIVCADATSADFSKGTIFYFYNPFGAETMRTVLGKLEASWRESPRKMRLCFHNNQSRSLLKDCCWLETRHTFSTFSGSHVDFYETRT